MGRGQGGRDDGVLHPARDPFHFSLADAFTICDGYHQPIIGPTSHSFDTNLGVYSADEIWTFDLAFGVIALIGTLDGLTGKIRAMTASNVQSLDWYAQRHAWKKAMNTAGEGPVPLRELRAAVPHRG